MSQPTRWSLVCAVCVVAWLALAFACAHGGSTDGDNQDANVDVPIDAPALVKQDSNVSTMVDAKADGSVVVQDAFVPPQQDAPSGPFCMNNSQCTNAGECCVSINMVGFCAPGTVIVGICFPN